MRRLLIGGLAALAMVWVVSRQQPKPVLVTSTATPNQGAATPTPTATGPTRRAIRYGTVTTCSSGHCTTREEH